MTSAIDEIIQSITAQREKTGKRPLEIRAMPALYKQLTQEMEEMKQRGELFPASQSLPSGEMCIMGVPIVKVEFGVHSMKLPNAETHRSNSKA